MENPYITTYAVPS